MTFGAAAPWALARWNLAERFGWTLADVDRLTLADYYELEQIDAAKTKARAFKHG